VLIFIVLGLPGAWRIDHITDDREFGFIFRRMATLLPGLRHWQNGACFEE
jgi:hypothetical protein